jgi:hypothetical protein
VVGGGVGGASLVVFDQPGVLWNARARLRSLVLGHLGEGG